MPKRLAFTPTIETPGRIQSPSRDYDSGIERVLMESTKLYYDNAEFHARVEEAVNFVGRFFRKTDGEPFEKIELERIRVMFSVTFYVEDLKKEKIGE